MALSSGNLSEMKVEVKEEVLDSYDSEIVKLPELKTKINIENTDNGSHTDLVKDTNAESLMKCNYCDQTFKYKTSLIDHMNSHTGEKPYKCSYCAMEFSYNISLIAHMKIHTPYKCDQCDQIFSSIYYLENHTKIHSGPSVEKSYQCNLCKMVFSSKYFLKKHKANHTNENLYTCGKCNMAFLNEFILTKHNSICTRNSPYQCSKKSKELSLKGGNMSYIKVFTGEKRISTMIEPKMEENVEVTSHNIHDISISSEFKDKEVLKNNTDSDIDNLPEPKTEIKEEEIDYVLPTDLVIDAYSKTHTRDKTYKCSHCDMEFRCIPDYVAHVKSHIDDKPYKCSQCDKVFSCDSDIQLHMKIHIRKPHGCSQCDESFLTIHKLEKHKKIHTDSEKTLNQYSQ